MSENWGNIHIYTDGIYYNPKPRRIKASSGETSTKSKRGRVTGFSSASCRRLKSALMKLYVPNTNRVAITYTIPVQISVHEWRLLVKRWRQNLIRSGLACIWRIELQRRGVPHLHIVGYANSLDEVGLYWLAWVKACDTLYEGDIPVTSHDGFLIYGFCARWINGSRWYAYLAAHTSKHKTSQLGWQGRQWGIVLREKFKLRESDMLNLSWFVAVRLARVVRRMFRYKGFTADCFGSRSLFGFDSVRRVVEFYSLQESCLLAQKGVGK